MYDLQPRTQMTLLAAMDTACDDITADACRGWMRHFKRFFPRCITREYIHCDVDENLWPNRQERREVKEDCTVIPTALHVQYMYCIFLSVLQ